jgi:hypothetical protein
MAWTAPRTWTTSEIVTASIMNTHVRDNLLETGPAKASTAGGFIIGTGTANTITERASAGAVADSLRSTTSTSYTDLPDGAHSTTVTTGTRALVYVGAYASNDTGGAESWISFAVSGATTLSAANSNGAGMDFATADEAATISSAKRLVSLTAGSNTFTAKYRASAGTASFQYRNIWVLPA